MRQQNTLTTPLLVPDNLLTIKGDLDAVGPVQIGRSSGVTGVATMGTIVQQRARLTGALQLLDLGQNEQGINTMRAGYGHGLYEYRSGTLEVSQIGGAGFVGLRKLRRSLRRRSLYHA